MAASTDFFTSAGTNVYISAGVPATYDAAGFGALTFTEIEEVTNIGAIGATRAVVKHTTLSDGIVHKRKGSTDYGEMSLTMGRVITDAGQALVLAAVASNASYAFKITLQDSTNLFFQGQVTSYPITIGGNDSVVTSEVSVALDQPIVEVAPA